MSFMTMLTKKFSLPGKDDALPGRSNRDRAVGPAFRKRQAACRALSGGNENRSFRHGLLLGSRTPVLADLRRLRDGRRLCGRLHPENPTYHETCTGRTGHTEAVLVVYDPAVVSLEDLLKVFWENHDPTQGMRQGNDTGTQYRSAIYVNSSDDLALVERTKNAYQGGAVGRRGHVRHHH